MSTLPFGASISSVFNRMLFQEGTAANVRGRIPVVWESPLSMREGRSLRMVINPQAIEFQQAKRITQRDVIGGKVFYHWTDARGLNNDVLTLTFRGLTGSIDPNVLRTQGTAGRPYALGNMAKHLAWTKLYQMTADPIRDPLTNRLNLTTCTLQTVLIPVPIQFEGHFPAVMSFSDTAEQPYNKAYSFQFVVKSITPPLNTLVSLMQLAFVTGADLSALQRPLATLSSL